MKDYVKIVNKHLKPPFSEHVRHEIAIDNTIARSNPEESGLTELRDIIIKLAKKLPSWGATRPYKWMLLANKLEEVGITLQQEGRKPQLRLSEVRQHGKTMGINSEEEVLAFLTFHHNLGDLIYFNEPEMRDIVILSPQWFGDRFRYFYMSGTSL